MRSALRAHSVAASSPQQLEAMVPGTLPRVPERGWEWQEVRGLSERMWRQMIGRRRSPIGVEKGRKVTGVENEWRVVRVLMV